MPQPIRHNRSPREILAQLDAAQLSRFDLALLSFFVDAAERAPHALFSVTDLTRLTGRPAPDIFDGLDALQALDLLDVSDVTRRRSGHTRTAYAFELLEPDQLAHLARRLHDRLDKLDGRPADRRTGR